LYLLVPWVFLRLIWRGLANPAYFQRWPERFGFIPRLADDGLIWVHAVSVGETRAAVPMVEQLLGRYPRRRLLITTMTPTGSDQVRALFGKRVEHCYVPYDLPDAVARFLSRARPRLGIIMETEYWPNLYHACAARRIPLLVANVRLSERSMHGYLRFAALSRQTVNNVSLFGVQARADAARLQRIGAPASRVRITGNIKFELEFPASQFELAQVVRREWGQERPVWIAASTREGEEEYVLAAFAAARRQFPDLLLVLVPRHPERFAGVELLCQKSGFKTELRSEQQGRPLDESVQVYIGDTMGELMTLYAASDVAYVGGSLVNTGGHNLLEPCAVGVPVIFGPHVFNFVEVSRLVLEREAGLQVRSAEELGETVVHLLADANRRDAIGENGKRLIEENKGALHKTLALVEELLQQS
jgi:3-deoxy-D-manno-octulosonic-acid transferase